MTTSIFIRSYDKDFEWLSYALRSIQKFTSGFCEIVIAVPEGQDKELKHLTAERIVPVHDGQPGYLGQMVDKLNADIHCRGDFILHADSDAIFTKPVTPDSFMEGDRVRWLMTPWKDCPDAKKAWGHVMYKLIGECPTHDFMRKSTIMVPRWAYAEFRAFIKSQTGYEMDAYIMNQPNREFSEYNCIGFYLWLYHRDKIAWHDTSTDGVPDIGEIQHWSWGGLTPEIRNQMAVALA